MDILYTDRDILVCIKPHGILSTDEPGGLPELVRAALQDPSANIRTVHRLDRVVGGLMVLARRSKAASELSRQIREGEFHKEYLAVLSGIPEAPSGELLDYLTRDPKERKTYVSPGPGPEAKEAILRYETLATRDGMALVKIRLITGRTHQIRCQFSSRGLALAGDRKYGGPEAENIALWSHQISLRQPYSGESLTFTAPPPDAFPWNQF